MAKVEITIGKTGDVPGVPVMLDWNEEIQQHVDRFMKHCIAFPSQRYQPEVSVQDRHALALLKSPYPDLPECKIGEFQWPAGLSRYGRAMYLVDWRALLEIAERAWGYEIQREEPREGETEGRMIKPDFGPGFNWGSKNNPVNLHFNSDMIEYPAGQVPEGGQAAWTKSTDPYVMYALPPIPLSEQYDVWVVRLVDIRYFRLQAGPYSMPSGPVPNDADWDDVISIMQKMFGPNTGSNNIGDILGEITTFTIDSSITSGLSSFGVPSRPIFDNRIPLLFRLEAAALTIGGRFFYDGYRTLTLRSHNNAREEVIALVTGADAIATVGKETIAGGFTGKAVGIKEWRKEGTGESNAVHVQPLYFIELASQDNQQHNNPWNVLETTWAIHTGADEAFIGDDWRSGVRTATTNRFLTFRSAYLGRVEYWNEIEYCLTYPGVFEYRKCCYTDYYSIVNDGRDCYTVVKSLPIDWRPRCLFAQPPGHHEAAGLVRGRIKKVHRNEGGAISAVSIQPINSDGTSMVDDANQPIYLRASWPWVDEVETEVVAIAGREWMLRWNNNEHDLWTIIAWDCNA